MKYSDLKINFEENKKQIVEAFLIVLGEEYRELFEKNINNIVLIDYITKTHYQRYLSINGINEYNNEDYIKDEETEYEIYKKTNDKYIKKLLELMPNNKTAISELKKSLDDPYYETPLFNSDLQSEHNDISAKCEILDYLGYNISNQDPYFKYLTKNRPIIQEYWDRLFNFKETDILSSISKEFYDEYRSELMLNTGNLKEKRDYYNSKNLLIKKDFDYDYYFKRYDERSVFPNICENNNEVAPVLIFSPLSFINSDHLSSFIHEVTHAISIKIISSEDTIDIKTGILKYYVPKNKEAYDKPLLFKNKELEKKFHDRYYLNEAMTQFIATLVTEVILEHNMCNNLFSFGIPEQRAYFEASYVNVVKFFKDFFYKNFEEVKQCYFGNTLLDSIGGIPFEKLVEYSNIVSGNSKMIEEISLEKSKEF